MIRSINDAILATLIFIIAFAAIGLLAGAMLALPFALLGQGAYMVASYSIAAVIAYRATRGTLEMLAL